LPRVWFMKILDRYIAFNVVGGCLLIMLILVTLFTFIDFVEQLDNVGKGDYQLGDACIYVILMSPRRMLDLLPAAALLGSSLALGWLAGSNQIVVMRAAGVSMLQIVWAVMIIGIVLMVVVVGLAEFVAPPLQQHAYERQLVALGKIRDQHTDNGFWSRDGMRFISIRHILHGRIPTDIEIYEFNEAGQLLSFTHADSADISQHEHWVLKGVWQKILDGKDIATLHLPSRLWDTFLTNDQVQVLEYPSDSLSPSDLYQYIQYLQDSGQQTKSYEVQLWQKLVLPFTTGAMVLLSIPFVFGLPRLTNTGQRILLGAMVGIVLYFLNQIVSNLGVLLNLSAPVVVLIPLAVILGFALLLFRRVR
jgi:lipopolysaccharide export system permease protein